MRRGPRRARAGRLGRRGRRGRRRGGRAAPSAGLRQRVLLAAPGAPLLRADRADAGRARARGAARGRRGARAGARGRARVLRGGARRRGDVPRGGARPSARQLDGLRRGLALQGGGRGLRGLGAEGPRRLRAVALGVHADSDGGDRLWRTGLGPVAAWTTATWFARATPCSVRPRGRASSGRARRRPTAWGASSSAARRPTGGRGGGCELHRVQRARPLTVRDGRAGGVGGARALAEGAHGAGAAGRGALGLRAAAARPARAALPRRRHFSRCGRALGDPSRAVRVARGALGRRARAARRAGALVARRRGDGRLRLGLALRGRQLRAGVHLLRPGGLRGGEVGRG